MLTVGVCLFHSSIQLTTHHVTIYGTLCVHADGKSIDEAIEKTPTLVYIAPHLLVCDFIILSGVRLRRISRHRHGRQIQRDTGFSATLPPRRFISFRSAPNHLKSPIFLPFVARYLRRSQPGMPIPTAIGIMTRAVNLNRVLVVITPSFSAKGEIMPHSSMCSPRHVPRRNMSLAARFVVTAGLSASERRSPRIASVSGVSRRVAVSRHASQLSVG